MDQIAELWKTNSGPWLTGLHLSCVFVQRRIQPLQNRAHPMWEYTGLKDTTRTKADELSRDEFDTRIRGITNIVGEQTPVLPAQPFSSDNPPTMVTALILLSINCYIFLRVKHSYFLMTSFAEPGL